MLMWTCFAIETTLRLSRSGGSVTGLVTRRTACCSWHTWVDGVTQVAAEDQPEDAEGPARVYLHYASGAAKVEISEGPVYELEQPVNSWIRGAADMV